MLPSVYIVAMTPFFIAPVDINVRTHLEGNDMERIEQRNTPDIRSTITNKLIVTIIENNGGKARYRPVKGKGSHLARFVFERKVSVPGKQLDLAGII